MGGGCGGRGARGEEGVIGGGAERLQKFVLACMYVSCA